MKRIVLLAVAGVGLAAFLNGSVADPASWALVLAVVAGAGFIAGRPKPPIGIDG
jgi:hypothetical protein